MKKGLWINGEWKMTAEWMEIQAPSSQEVLAHFAMATEKMYRRPLKVRMLQLLKWLH